MNDERISVSESHSTSLLHPAVSRPFLWGASTAGHQIEGNNVGSDYWVLEHVTPTIFAEPSGDTCDSYHRYGEDIALLAGAGLNAYRFSIEWARIEPVEGQFSLAELDHYKRVIEACHRHGVLPAVTFNHYTAPAWFAASGGWLRPDAADLFGRYCDRAARHLADGMEVAFTFNEPQGHRLLRIFPKWPGQDEQTAAMAAAAARRMGSDRFVTPQAGADLEDILQPMIDAHRQGYAAIKAARGDLPVGVTLAVLDLQATGPDSQVEAVCHDVDSAWMEAAKTGDFVGVQNYGRALIGPDGWVPSPEGGERTGWGDEVYPEGLANAVRYTHRATGLPIIISENGINTPDDDLRIRYTRAAVDGLRGPVDEGIPILGYMQWSLLDNYEWGHGYTPRFGLVAVDRETFARTPKPSLAKLGDIAREYGDALLRS